MEGKQLKENNLDIDLKREADSLKRNLEAISKKYYETDDSLRSVETRDSYGNTNRTALLVNNLSQNQEFLSLITKAEMEATNWLSNNS